MKHKATNPKSESRNPKESGNPEKGNRQGTSGLRASRSPGFGIPCSGIPSGFGFRISIFLVGLLLASPAGRAVERPPAPADTRAPPAAASSALTNAVLQLSDAQKTQAAAIMQAHRDAIQSTLKKSGEARRALFDAIHAEPFDEQAVRAASRRAAALDEELNVLRGRLTSELRAILTPPQRAAMDRMKSDLELSIESRSRTAGSLLDAWIEENARAAADR